MKINVKFLNTCLVLFIIGIMSGYAQKNVKIKGKIPSIKDGEVVLLKPTAKGVDTISSSQIAAHAFQLQIPLDEPIVALLQVVGYGGGFLAILEPGMTYEAWLEQDATEGIHGGQLQREYMDYQTLVGKHNARLREIRAELEEATEARHFKTVSKINKRLDSAQMLAVHQTDSILNRNRGSLLAAYLLTNGMQKADLRTMEATYAKLNEEERGTHAGQLYASYIKDLKALNIGAYASDFTLVDPNGNKHSLYAIPGKVKIIDFWASWCGPCRLENPNMIKLYNEFKESGVEVIGVSLDESSVKWVKAIKEDQINWIHLIAEAGWKSKVVQQYNIEGVPTIYVLDSNNKIIAKNLRGEKLRSFIKAYLDSREKDTTL